ncbi:something about silencing protein 10 [Prorops nasuta]|uniref:something about silencing protein 10 n=1 Tax=Prorops nasuta TaxID=863751 RepID=UPI0034CDB75F
MSRKRIDKLPLGEPDFGSEDITGSEDEYTEAEKNLLKKARTKQVNENYDSDDEVYTLQQDEEEDEDEDEDNLNSEADSIESDIEELQSDNDLPNERAWGQKKRTYYSTDYVDPDYASASQNDMDKAELEEKEAKTIQKRLAEQLDDADFGFDFVAVEEIEKTENDNQQIIKTDLTKLSKRQKLELIQKKTPEFLGLINDFKDYMTEAKDILEPFFKLIKSGKCPECSASSFLTMRYQLILNYCINISFYLMMKAKNLLTSSHPVIKRLAQYRQLINQLNSKQENLLKAVKDVVEADKQNLPLYNIADNSKIIVKTKYINSIEKRLKHLQSHKEEMDIPLRQDKSMDQEVESINESLENESICNESEKNDQHDISKDNTTVKQSLESSDVKRAITYEIAKNKGLMPYRKKEQRNPRVKHRNKYRKAKIRRKGAVREVRKEITKYAGEISGIKASVKKSIKLK